MTGVETLQKQYVGSGDYMGVSLAAGPLPCMPMFSLTSTTLLSTSMTSKDRRKRTTQCSIRLPLCWLYLQSVKQLCDTCFK